MLRILSHAETITSLKVAPGELLVICITNEDTPLPEEIKNLAAEVLHLVFDDNEFEDEKGISPQRHHIEKALEFAKDQEDLVICCHAGISRSAAMAYVIECSRGVHPAMAVGIWNKERHYPNRRIVHLGALVLNDPNIDKYYTKWINN